jgi:DNA-binding transcriptional LysR family regulator
MDDKEAFIKMCELRGFAAMAREMGISRQAVRKKYIKCGGNKRFKKN